jgi:DNA-binding SARP family transcriptional activator
MLETRILLLGTPEVQVRNQICQITRRVNRAVLFYLASAGQPISRNALLTLFWPEHTEISARARLRETLSRLGKTLPGCIDADPVRVTLNFTKVYVDQLHFEAILKDVGSLPWQISKDEPLPPAIYKKLREGVELWRGPRFIHGEDFPASVELENWHSLTNQRLEHQYVRLLERLSQHARLVNNPEECLQLSRRALFIDQLSEEWHAHLLECLIAMGRWNEGLEHFAFMESLFRKEHLLPISSHLKSLREQLKKSVNSEKIIDQEPDWNLRVNIMTPFVGRKQILEELQHAYHQGGGVFILGESGLGKTRVMQEFCGRVSTYSRVLLANCRSGEAVLPFQPFIELLRENVLPEEWANLSPSWISQLSLLLPELQENSSQILIQLPSHENPPSSFEARSQLMEAIRQILIIMGHTRKLLFCLDDAHWSDDASLSTVAYLINRPPFDTGLLIIAARQEEHSPALEVLLNNLQQARSARILRLPYLDYNEIAELVAYVTGSLPKESLVTQLTQETGGNPLFLLEKLRAMQEFHSAEPDKVIEDIPITLSLRNVISSRLRTLSQTAYQIIQVAAIIGVEFSPELVALASGSPSVTVNQALEELTSHQLIEPDFRPPHEVRYHFIHSSIREVLNEEINPIRKQWLHRQVAICLEMSGTPVDASLAAILARHYELGGEGLLSFEYWIKTGQYARQLFSQPEANNAFAIADQLIPYINDLPAEKIYDLFSEWAEMAYEAEDADTIIKLCERLSSIGLENNENLYLGTAFNLRCQADMIQNNYEGGIFHSNQAIASLGDCKYPAALMEAHIHRGIFLYMLNHIESALSEFQIALSLATNTPNRATLRARANANYQIALLVSLTGWPNTGLVHAQRSLEDFIELKRSYGQVMAYSVLTLNSYGLGEFDLARNYYSLGLDLAERTQAHRIKGYLHAYAGLVELITGNLDACCMHADKCIESGQKWHHYEIASLGHFLRGELFYILGDNKISKGYFQEAIQTNVNQFMPVDAMYRLGLLLFKEGQKKRGLEEIEQCIALAQSSELEGMLLRIQLTRAETLKCDQKWDELLQLCSFIQEESFRRGLIPTRILSTFYLAEADYQQGNYFQAATQFLSVAEEATRLPYVWVAIPAWIELAKTYEKLGIEDSSLKLRVEVLLERMEVHAHQNLVREAYKNYVTQFSN